MENKNNMTIQQQIKEARKAKNLTQVQAAIGTGYTQAYLSKIEAGKRKPTLTVLEKFCEVYDCQIIISK